MRVLTKPSFEDAKELVSAAIRDRQLTLLVGSCVVNYGEGLARCSPKASAW